MLPITSHSLLPKRDREHLHITDEYLARVLNGEEFLLFDGAMGTMLQAAGMKTGELPELLCLTHPQEITDIQTQYVKAGSQVITTNTFGANARKLDGKACVSEVFEAAVTCARNTGARYIAADIGPTGALLQPMGTLSFDDAYDLFAEQVDAAVKAGADIILIETMADLLEMKAAVLAAKEHSSLPIFATMTFGEDGRTFLGTSPQVAAMTLSALGVNVLGVNCSLGPNELLPLVDDLLRYAACPVMVQANAGLPQIVNGETVFAITPEEYADSVAIMISRGVSIVGGCCGTNPQYIKYLANRIAKAEHVVQRTNIVYGGVTSNAEAVVLQRGDIAVIGERINPTGKKRLKEALRRGDIDYVLGEAIDQVEAGANILDVNVGLPDINESVILRNLVGQLQTVTTVPLQIDSVSPQAIESAVRVYAGKPIINSVNGSRESLEAILPIAAHYGCAVVALTLDEAGLPKTTQGRFEIAERIVSEASSWGIGSEDIYVDCLALAVSADPLQAQETLGAIRKVTSELGLHTVLGVSNISFGLPLRQLINTTFLAAAFSAGLDMPIMDPTVMRNMEIVDTWRVLSTQDTGATHYIETYSRKTFDEISNAVNGSALQGDTVSTASSQNVALINSSDAGTRLMDMIITGRKGDIAEQVETLLETHDAMEIINSYLIASLDEVGQRFENGTFFLPQLMASAEAARTGFDVIRLHCKDDAVERKHRLAVATVKGDIHDIGKNIVKMLLENYGYDVYDLGRDVDPETIVDFVIEHDIKLLGLSALMTNTVHSMADTITLLRQRTQGVQVMVGGAVLTPEYAEMVGADFYAKDAAESARICAQVFGD